MMINNINKKEDNIVNINTTTSTPLTPEQRRIAERKARNARDNKKRMETLAKFVQPLAEAVANKNKDLEGQHILAPHGEDEWIPKQMKVEYYHATNTNHPRVKLSMKVYDKSYKRNEKGDLRTAISAHKKYIKNPGKYGYKETEVQGLQDRLGLLQRQLKDPTSLRDKYVDGDILKGIVQYLEIINHIKERDKE